MFENRPLDVLATSCPDLVLGKIKSNDFVHGSVLAEQGAPIDRVLFPRSGLVSTIVGLADGDHIGVGMLGADGAIGGGLIFGAKTHLTTSFAQTAGRAFAMRGEDVVQAAERCPEFHTMMFAEEQYQTAQANQTAACNAKHTIMHRLCSWLLRARDTLGMNELLVTQEQVAQMLGVQRASISMFASKLQDKGCIHYRRGRLQITDGEGLAEHACECHAIVGRHHARLFPRPDVQARATA